MTKIKLHQKLVILTVQTVKSVDKTWRSYQLLA